MKVSQDHRWQNIQDPLSCYLNLTHPWIQQFDSRIKDRCDPLNQVVAFRSFTVLVVNYIALFRELQRLVETFSVTYGEIHWQWKKLYKLINSHCGKRFLFVILWVFALYFDNYNWIINGLHHKELQVQCCRREPLCVSQFASNWN